ncbi:hypothetical protein SEUBUCD646_0O00560 [Saccharomyces eubayanus]|uniref:WSC domain-containing protein n=1 Tax=Saccharomyces eubayanus TaxID=1080349 RepID=A0ABN8VKD2_SACEU|nr:hypothetical protein SEUBUCD650_0O00610 [Saccharomyces eubayanus]CAI1738439.1 hypothetical protein SEUBUCD646_0O00560 [Saccharomyces eubayanus]
MQRACFSNLTNRGIFKFSYIQFILLSVLSQYLLRLVSADFNYEGCYNAEDVQSAGLSLKNSYLYQSVSYCQNQCPDSAVVALFDGSDCYCGDSVTVLSSLTKSTDSNCETKCSGWPYQMCGGSSYMNVYVNAKVSVSSVESSSTTEASTIPYITSTTRSSTSKVTSSATERSSSNAKSSTTYRQTTSFTTTSSTPITTISTSSSVPTTTTSTSSSIPPTTSSASSSISSSAPLTTSITSSSTSSSESTTISSSTESTSSSSSITFPSSTSMSSSSSSSTSSAPKTTTSASSGVSIITSFELITSMVTNTIVSTSGEHQETIFVTTTSVIERTSAVATADSSINKSNSNHKKGLSGGAIAGVVIGVVFGVIFTIAILLFLVWRRRKSDDPLDLEETKHHQPYSFGDEDANPVRLLPSSGTTNWMRHTRRDTSGSIGTSNMYGLSMNNGGNYSSPSSNNSGSVLNNLAGLQDGAVQRQNLPSTVFEETNTLNSVNERFSANSLPDMMMSGPLQVVNPDNPELTSTASHNRA